VRYVDSGGHSLVRSARHLRVAAPERLALAVATSGRSRTTQDGRTWTGTRRLVAVDLTRAYSSVSPGRGSAHCLVVDYRQLGLPVDIVRLAVPRLAASPLHRLVLRQLRDLPDVAERVDPGPVLDALGAAMTELVRALVVSAVPGASGAEDANAASLLARVLAYVDEHARDPDLTPARVAAAHHISLRSLYTLLDGQAQAPAELIMSRRLEGARRELARRAPDQPSISVTARQWGFPDAGHFARRFRAAFGVSPREWVCLHAPP
jgi:AraC-like DNA-binding protein